MVAVLRRPAGREAQAAMVIVDGDELAADTGAAGLVRGFAAALLCAEGGCGQCHTCRRALEGTHPDLVEVVHQGVSLGAEEARAMALVEEAARVLVRNPNEALLLQALPVRLGRPV
jgi:hypothetical protein